MRDDCLGRGHRGDFGLEMNRHLRTVIIAPMTAHGHEYPTRVLVSFLGVQGRVVLDQIRTIDKVRLVRRLCILDETSAQRVLEVLDAIFVM